MEEDSPLEKLSLSERCVSLLVVALVAFSVASGTMIQLVRTVIHLPYHLDTVFMFSLLALAVLIALPRLLQRISIIPLLVFGLMTMGILIGWLLSPETEGYYPTILGQFLLQCVLAYWVCSAIRADERTISDLSIAAFVITVCELLQLFVLNDGLTVGYSQSVGYNVLPAVVISLVQLFDNTAKYRLLHTANIGVGAFLLLSAGARGPLMCAALFGVFLFMISPQAKKLKVIVLLLSIAFAIFCFNGGLVFLLEELQMWMLNHDMSVRTINSLLAGDFLMDSARSLLAKYSWQEIVTHPFFGVGLGRDRILLARAVSLPISEAIGWYPHNLLLELFLHYGMLLGSVLIVGLTMLGVKGCWLGAEPNSRKLAQIFLGVGVLPLLFSGSYLTYPLFFAWVATSLRAAKTQAPSATSIPMSQHILPRRNFHFRSLTERSNQYDVSPSASPFSPERETSP